MIRNRGVWTRAGRPGAPRTSMGCHHAIHIRRAAHFALARGFGLRSAPGHGRVCVKCHVKPAEAVTDQRIFHQDRWEAGVHAKPRLHRLPPGRGPEGVRPTPTPAGRSPAAVHGLSRGRLLGDHRGVPAKRPRHAARDLHLRAVPRSPRHALRPGRAAARGAGPGGEPGLHPVPPRGRDRRLGAGGGEGAAGGARLGSGARKRTRR